MPLVSFVIPVKNRISLLARAISSCLAQTISDWEAIIVDDHSDDDIQGYISNLDDNRLVYVKLTNSNSGIGAARNLALQVASSDIFITLDSDDISYPFRAARCFDLLKHNRPTSLYTRVHLFSDNNPSGHYKPVLQPFNKDLLFRFNFITNPGTAFTREAYNSAGAFYRASLHMAEDYDLYIRMCKAGVEFLCIDECHVMYNKGSHSLTSNSKSLKHHIGVVRYLNQLPFVTYDDIQYYCLPALWSNLKSNPMMRYIWSDARPSPL